MDKLEVIIVNDGTPDKSAEISREYVKRFPETFRQIDKENGGHGSAWNVGLKEATGKYLRFLDSDDWLTNLSTFLEKLSSCDADIIITRLNRYYEAKDLSKETQCPKTIDKVMSINSIGPEEFSEYDLVANFWFSTYKASVLKPLYPLFLEGISYDDSILFIVPLLFAKNYIAYDIVLYNYLLERQGQSMEFSVQKKKIPDRIKVLQQMCSFYNENTLRRENDWLLKKVIGIRRNISVYLISYIKSFRQSYSYSRELKSIKGITTFNPQTKLYRRFKSLPFVLFYTIERLREYTSRKS
jgi:glycosyltransferase involved in cell wall biosynthesis